jgi:NAD dependent epimerase/dehydratase family enzyme
LPRRFLVIISTKAESAAKEFPQAKIVSWNNYISLANENIDVIINLAGRNVGDKRWNDEFKKRFMIHGFNQQGKL